MTKKVLIGILILAICLNAKALDLNVDPNGDSGPNEYSIFGPGGIDHYETVDDGIRYPSTPTGGLNEQMGPDDVGGSTEVFDMATGDLSSGTISQITVYYYVSGYDDTQEITPSIYVDAGWTAGAAWSISGAGWQSRDFSGTWDQTDLDALKTRFVSDNDNSNYVSGIYAEVTYTAGGANGSPDINYNSPNYGYYNSATIDFNVSDPDASEVLKIDLWHSATSGGFGTLIYDDFDVNTELCDDADFTDSTNCSIVISPNVIHDGNRFIDINVFDDSYAGDWNGSTNSILWDNNAPTNSWDGNHGTPWNTIDQNIHLTCYDNESGCETIQYRLDSDATGTCTLGAWVDYNSGIELGADGNFCFEFKAIDRASLESDVNGQYDILIDKSLPSGKLIIDAKVDIIGDFNVGVHAQTLADEWTVRSWRSIKENPVPITDKNPYKDSLIALQFYTYNLKDEQNPRIGLMADEVPLLLGSDENGINLYALVSTMAVTIQEQEERIAELESQQAANITLLDWIVIQIAELWKAINPK